MSKYNKLQEAMVEAMELKVGDKVRVLRKFEYREMGFREEWFPQKEQFLIGEHKVKGIERDRILLQDKDERNWCFPIFVLQKIENAKIELSGMSGEIQSDGAFKVNSITIPFEKIEEIYLAAKKTKN